MPTIPLSPHRLILYEGGAGVSQVTVGERVLVHLSWYVRFSDAFECPRETTQDGIAGALGISRAHAALELKRLKASARVEERMAHVPGARTRRKVYFLTPTGAGSARVLRDHARAKSVLFTDAGDRRQVLGAEAIEALKARGIREPEATQLVLSGDLLDPRARRTGRIRELPAAEPFVDREVELLALRSWLESGARFAIVVGVAGIGKTALATHAASLWEGPIWYRKVHGFEDARTFAGALGDFLFRVDRPRLRNYLASGAFDADGLAAILREDLQGVLLVIDDVPASPDVAGVLRLAVDGDGVKVLATGRERPDALSGGGQGSTEIVLGGLSTDASRALVAGLRGGRGDGVEPIVAAGRGHPMALRLLAGTDPEGRAGAERLLEDAIFEGLDAGMEHAAALFAVLRKPCERPRDLGVSPSRLRRLLRRGLLARGPSGLVLHDLVKEVLLPRLPTTSLRSAHRAAAHYASRRGDPIEAAFHLAEGGRRREARDLLLRNRADLLDSASVGELARLLSRLPMNPGGRLLLAEALDRIGRGGEASALLEGIAGVAHHPARGDALLLLGRIASRRNALAEAQGLLREAVSVATARGNPRLEGVARRYLALVHRKAGDMEGAERDLDLAIPLLESSGDPRERVRARLDRAVLRLQRGDPAGAAKDLEGLLSEPGAGPREEAAIRSNLAIAWARMDRPREAAGLFEESARAAERGGDFRAAGYALANAADAYLAADQVPEAESSLARARRVSEGFADPLLESTVLTNEGKVLAAQGRVGPAEERLRAGIERIRGLGNLLSLIERVDELARFYEAAGRTDEALLLRRETEGLRSSIPKAGIPTAVP
jgi:tetratricopeptide (TPR) repeat protein